MGRPGHHMDHVTRLGALLPGDCDFGAYRGVCRDRRLRQNRRQHVTQRGAVNPVTLCVITLAEREVEQLDASAHGQRGECGEAIKWRLGVSGVVLRRALERRLAQLCDHLRLVRSQQRSAAFDVALESALATIF